MLDRIRTSPTRAPRGSFSRVPSSVISLGVASLLGLAATGCDVAVPRPGLRSANQYASVQPVGGSPVLTGYQFDLMKRVEAEACAEGYTTYNVAIAGLSGEPSLGELAAAHEALGALKDADMLLVIRSHGSEVNGRHCGSIVARGVKFRTADFAAPAPSTGSQPTTRPQSAPVEVSE